jgi:hypothetical protein
MKRIGICALFFVIIAAGMAFAQDVGDPDASQIGIESAQQLLKEVSVDKFEAEGFWRSRMSTDQGFTSSRLFVGGPLGKEPIPEEDGMEIPDENVLGVRVDFLRRGHNSFTIRPLRPIPIEGVTKTVSLWVVGRNFNHDITLLLQDFSGKNYEIYRGRRNFQGWRRLTAAIPPQSMDGRGGVVQRSYHYNNQMGIRITGFRIDTNPMESFGSYYVYFDDLRAVTDLFAEQDRDPDDMSDGW